MSNLYECVIDILKKNTRFFSEDGELLRTAVYEAAMKMDENLIKLLYENEETKKRFFTFVSEVAVFDKVGFGWVVNNRQFLPDSYTRYKNKIGLVDKHGDFISSSDDIRSGCCRCGYSAESEGIHNAGLAADEGSSLYG